MTESVHARVVAEPSAALTEEEWQMILEPQVQGGRPRRFRLLITPEQVKRAGERAVSCGSCAHTTMHGDPRRGFCLAHSCMVSLAFPMLCRKYVAR